MLKHNPPTMRYCTLVSCCEDMLKCVIGFLVQLHMTVSWPMPLVTGMKSKHDPTDLSKTYTWLCVIIPRAYRIGLCDDSTGHCPGQNALQGQSTHANLVGPWLRIVHACWSQASCPPPPPHTEPGKLVDFSLSHYFCGGTKSNFETSTNKNMVENRSPQVSGTCQIANFDILLTLNATSVL